MSLHCQPVPAIPEEPARVAQAAFSKGNLYLRMRDELGSLYCDEDFAVLYPQRGQPTESPWRLALISVMQFMENLSDRQADEAVRARIDWKYVLSLDFFKNKHIWENEKAQATSTNHGSELFQPNSASGRCSSERGQKNDWLRCPSPMGVMATG